MDPMPVTAINRGYTLKTALSKNFAVVTDQKRLLLNDPTPLKYRQYIS